MQTLMNVVLTTVVSVNNVPAVTSVAFASVDEPDCNKTARMILGNSVSKIGVEWVLVVPNQGNGHTRKTVVCFPRNTGEQTDE